MIDIFKISSNHAEWNAQRRLLVATNVSNVNTPGYKSRDVLPFEAHLHSEGPALLRTSSRHLPSVDAVGVVPGDEVAASNVQHSGNTVDLAQEMLRAGDVNREHGLNTGIVRSFHRMVLSSLRG